jgi:acyl dehydratase
LWRSPGDSIRNSCTPTLGSRRRATPLRPGEPVRLRTTILGTRRSRSKPDRGLVRTHAELLNASDGCPLSLTALNFLSLRSPETP